MPSEDVCLYLLALFLPPVSVFLKSGCGPDFWINILLSILGWIPGVLHAWYIISRNPAPAAGGYGTTGRGHDVAGTGTGAAVGTGPGAETGAGVGTEGVATGPGVAPPTYGATATDAKPRAAEPVAPKAAY